MENCASVHGCLGQPLRYHLLLLIKSERCRPQEFSDEDAEEDIDALMSAHSKTPSRRLSNAVSTVTPMLNTKKKCHKHILGEVVNALVQYKHILTHSVYTRTLALT